MKISKYISGSIKYAFVSIGQQFVDHCGQF